MEENSDVVKRNDDDASRFEPLLGLYDVSFVQTAKDGDNPVGGKWTRKNKLAQQIFSTRRTFQHLVPTNSTGVGRLTARNQNVVGEAINVISLDALFRLIRLTVILRGDAIALTKEERESDKVVKGLSNLTVRALFDSPRLILGKRGRFFNISLGPSTSVVLDSTYADNVVRIGRGGTSGSRFVFMRCSDDDVEAGEFRQLLMKKPTKKGKLLSILGLVGGTGVWASVIRGSRLLGGGLAISAALCACAISFSTGGVEDDGDDDRLD